MKFIYVYPVDHFDRNADEATIIRAWKKGIAQRYTPELFAETINDEAFNEVGNWVRVIDEPDGYFQVSCVHRDDLESIGYNTSKVDDSTMKKVASKLSDDICEQVYWESLSIIAYHLGIPERRKRKLKT
jgi:hypothetical protein